MEETTTGAGPLRPDRVQLRLAHAVARPEHDGDADEGPLLIPIKPGGFPPS